MGGGGLRRGVFSQWGRPSSLTLEYPVGVPPSAASSGREKKQIGFIPVNILNGVSRSAQSRQLCKE